VLREDRGELGRAQRDRLRLRRARARHLEGGRHARPLAAVRGDEHAQDRVQKLDLLGQ
jgi:hypothetical protein